jgi:hypothetical protein
MLKFGDRARQTTTTTGTGPISLDGIAPAGWFTFAESGIGSGRACHYLVELPNGTDIAIIEGTFTSGSPPTLTRSRIIRSKIGGVAGTTNPSLTGTSTVTCVWTAEDADTANPVLATPAISAGTLVIDLDKNAESAHRITLNQNVSAGGISFVNPPSGYCKVYIQFDQATPSGTAYDVPITAWTGGPGTVTFDTDYSVYQDATPTVVWLTSTDGMATARARMNVELISYLATTDIDTLAKLNAIVTDADLTSTAHAHTGGLGAQIAYSSLSGLPTLGTAASQNTTAFEASGAISTHAALTETHGISSFGASLVDDANATAARTTLGLGTAATSATGDFAAAAHASSHLSGGGDAIKLDDLATPDDNTDLNATVSRHGLLPKLGGGTTNYLRADGAWAAPAGGGGGGAESGLVIAEATSLGGSMSCYFVEASTLG